MKRDWLIGLGIGLLMLLLFAPARRHEFINYDDPRYVLDPIVQRGVTLDGARWAFTTFNFANYHPITWLSHMIDAQLFGTKPPGHHLHNVMLHGLNAAVLYWLLTRLTGLRWESAIAAALWAVHPLRVESVAWASERKDLLSLLFALLSIAAYVRWVKTRSAAAYGILLLLFTLSLLSKSMSVSLPLILLLLDWWPLKRPLRWELLREKLPLFALSIAMAIVTLIAQRQGGAMDETIYPLPLRLSNVIASYGRYLLLTFWPAKLAFFYPYQGALPGTVIPPSTIVFSVIALIAVSVIAWRNRTVMVGWLWVAVTLIPTIGLIQVGPQSMADRYTYLPHVGLLVAIVFGVSEIARSSQPARIACGVVAAVIVVALCIRTRQQLATWQNNVTLYTHAIAVTSNNHVAHSQLGMEYMRQVRFADAIVQYKNAARIKPRDAQPYYNIGVAYHKQGDRAAAKSWYLESLRYFATFPEALVGMGNVLAEEGNDADAIPYFQRAAEAAPNYFIARYNLALSLANAGRVADALPEFAAATQLDIENPAAHLSYGLALQKMGRQDEAQYEFIYARNLAIQYDNPDIAARAERQLSPPSSVPSTTRRSL